MRMNEYDYEDEQGNPYTNDYQNGYVTDHQYEEIQQDGPYTQRYDEQYEPNYINASGKPPEEKKKKKKFFFWLFFFTALCVFLYSAYQLFTILKANWDEKRELEKITEIANIPENPEEPFTINWEGLREINDQVVAWMIIPNTNMSYPIVQGNDNTYYLNRTFEKEYNYAGAIFLDYNNKPDFSDNNTFIYGHNVRHGTMFAQLEKFTDANFFAENKYVYIFTPTQNYKSEIVSFHSTKDRSDYYKYGITDINEWKDYIDLITDPNIDGYVNTNVTVGESDRLISLSTCSYEINDTLTDQRYLLHAKLVPWIGEYTEPSGQE